MADQKEEMFDLVGPHDHKIGVVTKSKMQKQKLWHRAVRVLVENEKGEMLLAKRPKDKDVFPDCWEIGIGGGVRSGETYHHAAARELREELGIRRKRLKFMTKIVLKIPQEKLHAKIYWARHKGRIDYDKKEVDGIIFIQKGKIREFHRKNRIHNPGFVHYFKLVKEGKIK